LTWHTCSFCGKLYIRPDVHVWFCSQAKSYCSVVSARRESLHKTDVSICTS
jgi:ribosomal protein L24E